MVEVTGKRGFLHHDVVATSDQYGDKTSHVIDKCIMYSEHNSADGELSQTVRQSELSHSDPNILSDRQQSQQHSQHTVIHGH